MAKQNSMDTMDCPQFVDFGTVHEDQEDIDFNFPFALGGISPGLKEIISGVSSTPFIQSKIKHSTPFLNPFLAKKTLAQSACRKISKRLSKSDGDLNHHVVNLKERSVCSRITNFERSLSEDNIKIKRKVYPTTPMCLKRPKVKKLKSTEEIELEKIAEMQKQTKDRIRSNLLSLRRMNLKPKPMSVPVVRHQANKEEVIRKVELKFPQKAFIVPGPSTLMEKINAYSKKVREEAQREKVLKAANFTPAQWKKPILSTNTLGTASTNTKQNAKSLAAGKMKEAKGEAEEHFYLPKPVSIKKFPFHSGVLFPNNRLENRSGLKPFNFLSVNSVNALNSATKNTGSINRNIKDRPFKSASDDKENATLPWK